MKKEITFTILSNWVVLFINIAISFLLAPFVVHKLGNVYYGIWSIVMQFTGYLYLMDFGVRDSVIRYTSRLNAKQAGKQINQVISTALVLYSGIGVVSIIVALVGAGIFPLVFKIPSEMSQEVRIVVLITGLSIAQSFVFNVFSGILIGLQRNYLFNVFNIFLAFVRAGLIVFFLNAGYRIVALSSIHLFIGAVSGIVLMVLAKKLLEEAGLPFRFGLHGPKRFYVHARRLFNYSKYVFIINIASKVIFTTDALVIGFFMNVGHVTFYAIAGNLIGYLIQVMTASSSVFNPMTSHLDALEKNEKVQEVLSTGTRFNLFIGFPIAAAYIFLGEEFIELWMGPEYAEQAASVLTVLGLTQLLTLHQYTISGVIFGLGKHKALAYWRVAEAAANLVLSVTLIKPFGIVGVALGTAIPHTLISLVVFPIYAKRITDISLKRYWTQAFVRPIVAIAPFVAMALLVKHKVSIESLPEYFIYVFALSFFYCIVSFHIVLMPNERVSLANMLKKWMVARHS